MAVSVMASGFTSLSPVLVVNSISPISARTENAPASRFTNLKNAQIGITTSLSLFHQIARLAPRARLAINLGTSLGACLIAATIKFLSATRSNVLLSSRLLNHTTVSAGTPLFLMEGLEEAIVRAPTAVPVEDQAQAQTGGQARAPMEV